MAKAQILFSRNRIVRLAEDAALLGAALMLSYVEALFPLTLFIPLPGAKLGLANIAVMLAYYRYSAADAAVVSAARVLLVALLFGSASSFFFSATGAFLSFVVICVLYRWKDRCFSFVGISMLAAAAHNLGQVLCAAVWLHTTAVFYYLPVLLLLAVIFGGISGFLMNMLSARIAPVRKVRKAV